MSCTQKQQLVCFPKVRVYKPWFRHFNDHKDFRNEGTVHLFSLMALFSYANFRSNERVINGDRYHLFQRERYEGKEQAGVLRHPR